MRNQGHRRRRCRTSHRRPGDEQYAAKTGYRRQPGSERDFLAEERAGEQRNDERGGKDQRRGFRKRQRAEGEHDEQGGADQQESAEDHQPRTFCNHNLTAHAGRDAHQHTDEVNEIARPDNQRNGKESGQIFRARIKYGKEEGCDQYKDDAKEFTLHDELKSIS